MSAIDRQKAALASHYHDFNSGGTLGASYRNEWAAHASENMLNRYYYSGEFAYERVSDSGDGREPPLKYPLGVNIARWLCMSTARILLGMVEPNDDFPIDFVPDKTGSGASESRASAAAEAWRDINDETPLLAQLLRGAPESGVDGGFYIQVKRVPRRPPWLVYREDSQVLPVWHPDNPDRLRECSLELQISHDEAAYLIKQFGGSVQEIKRAGTGSQNVSYVETWTEEWHTIRIDDKEVYKHPNMIRGEDKRGQIPFIYFPRDRTKHQFYGDSLIPEIVGLLKELNIRMANIGDSVEYNAHPVFYASNTGNLPRYIPSEPGRIVNLGKNTSVNNPGANPELGVVEATGVHESAFQFVELLVRMLMFMASITSVDVGEDEGSQRSGMTLEVRKLPAIQQALRTRALWSTSIRRLVVMALTIYKQSVPGSGSLVVPRLRDIRPKWPEMLPADLSDIVNMIVQLLSPSDYPRIPDEMIADLLPFVEDSTQFLDALKAARERAEKEKKAMQEVAMKKAEAQPTQRDQQNEANKAKKAET